ncbi:MAG TPA: hypothetical protein VFX79_02960 [Candidatus Saccharimonadales bacterium]|nr:hypothetical protein [Candidatus Saccharimonadales bacterium]
MAGAGNDSGANNGAEKGPEVSLPGALNAGEEHQGIAGEQGAIRNGLDELEARREDIEARHERDLAQVKAYHEIELEELEGQQAPLVRRRAELEGEVKSQQGKVSHWKGRLRTLASKPGALRGDQLLYAAFATNGDTSRDGLDTMAEVDDTVRENGGETFVVLQEGHLSFGRIREDNEGLLIDTSLESDSSSPDYIERVRLPVQSYDMGGQETSYAYGWVSGNFDERKHDYSQDPVLHRHKDEDDEVKGGGWLCKVQIEGANLHLTDPTSLRILDEFDGEVKAEELLKRGDDGFMLTGEAASKFLHQFIDSRIGQISDEWDTEASAREASRWSALASRLGVSVDLTKLERFKPGFDDI